MNTQTSTAQHIALPPADTDMDARRTARAMYFQGWRISSIARALNIPRGTIDAWKHRDEWERYSPLDRVELTMEQRLIQLISLEKKEGRDFKEIDLLGRQIERMARVRRYQQPGGHAGDLNPKVANRNKGERKAVTRNIITEEQHAQIIKAFTEGLFDYQRAWYSNRDQRNRMILKSRQIGATWYFAREALADALETGRNQIFLSASKAQAHVFKQYIKSFAMEAAEAELSGDPIVLPNGATLYFLGSNSRTAQSYHGNFYFDEFFWVHDFETLNKVASAMAVHKHWRRTYFSTPSSILHPAHKLWTAEKANSKLPKDKQFTLDVSHAALENGAVGGDNFWRQIVTVEDAENGGCNLFNIDELRMEYSADQFANLFMCEFIDDGESLFPLTAMQRCMVDSWLEWDDFKPFTNRPLGNSPVWVGYDPADTGDSAGLIALAPPLTPNAKFRVLEKHQFRGLDFESQAQAIKKITEKYSVQYLGIDATGLGSAVYQLVKVFYPAARAFRYSPEVKAQLVLKALDVVSKGRLEFDAGWTDLAASFMAIKKTLTASGKQVTYQASRAADISHADLAWACMHALANEPLEGATRQNQSFMEIY
jgi:uncharacterized protein YjcR